MIRNKEDLKLYLEADRIALGRKRYTIHSFFFDRIWTFERLLRKEEYYYNCCKGFWGKMMRRLITFRKHRLHTNMDIQVNSFGPGLSIAHEGAIVVNGKCKIGKNCRIHIDVVLGQGRDNTDIPVLGDNIHIGPGVKILGGVHVGDNTVIAANAVVTKSFPEGNCTIGGIPARKISDHSSLTPSGNMGRGLLVQGYELALTQRKSSGK